MSDEQEEIVRQEREYRGRRKNRPQTDGAKTFRRGRAIAFLEHLRHKEAVIKKQLTSPELQAINPILVGELKAIDMVIEEYIRHFHLNEITDETEQMKESDDNHETNK